MRLRKRRGDDGKPPDIDAVIDHALSTLGREYDRREDHVDIKLTHGWRGYSLDALKRRMQARPADTWLGIATKDLRETVELAEREDPVPEWPEAQPMLKLRMHLREKVPASTPLGVPFGDDVLGVLALDRGDRVTLVKLVDANHWGRPFDDLLEIARRNTRAEPGLKHERIQLKGGGGEAVLCSSEGRFFAAAQALWPETLLGEIGRLGALVAVPNPHVAMAYAIDDARTLAAIDVLAPWTQRRVAAVQNPISPHLYWWRPGSIQRLDAEPLAELRELLGPAPAPEPPKPPKPSSSSTTRGRLAPPR